MVQPTTSRRRTGAKCGRKHQIRSSCIRACSTWNGSGAGMALFHVERLEPGASRARWSGALSGPVLGPGRHWRYSHGNVFHVERAWAWLMCQLMCPAKARHWPLISWRSMFHVEHARKWRHASPSGHHGAVPWDWVFHVERVLPFQAQGSACFTWNIPLNPWRLGQSSPCLGSRAREWETARSPRGCFTWNVPGSAPSPQPSPGGRGEGGMSGRQARRRIRSRTGSAADLMDQCGCR